MPSCPKPEKKEKQKKRRPKSERQLLDAECCELLKQIVRLRDGGCVTPGPSCGGYLTASHYHKRGKTRLKYDLRNVNCQCKNCNGRHNNYQGPYELYMLTHYGPETVKELAELSCINQWKWSIPELRAIRDALRVELDSVCAKYQIPLGSVCRT